MAYTSFLLYSVFTHALGSASFGYGIGEINPIAQSLSCNYGRDNEPSNGRLFRRCIPMNEVQVGVIVSIFAIGGLVGSSLTGRLIDRHGRRKISLFNCASFILGSVAMGCANDILLFGLGRFLVGVGSGVSMISVPIYLAEVSPPSIRGTIGVMTQISIVLGILLGQVLGVFYEGASTWRPIVLVGACLGAAQLMLLVATPESPKWLILQPGKHSLAQRTLARLRGKLDVDDEIQAWKANAATPDEFGSEMFTTHGALPFKRFIQQPQYRRAIQIVLITQLAQQLTGTNAVIFYSNSILSTLLPRLTSWIAVMIQLVNLGVTLIAAYAIERTGRRFLLLSSLAGMGLCSALLCVGLVKHQPILSAVSAIAMIGSFGLGLGPLPFLLANELLEVEAVGHAQSLGLSVNWLGTFSVGLLFPVFRRAMGDYVFVLFSSVAALSFVSLWRLLPESKGKTPREVWQGWE